MRWADAHRLSMGLAFEAHEDLGLDTLGRVDVFDAIVREGLKLHFRPLDCAALYLPASVAGRPGVLVNGLHPLALQRYSAAHELGHHLFGHGEQIDRETEPRGTGAPLPAHEMLAEAFASWFMMPPEAVEAALRLLGLDQATTPEQAYALSLRLGASFRATCNRIPELGRWRDHPVKELKLGLTGSPPLGGWRHDVVWLLSERDADARVFVRAGDTLLIDLPSWTIEALPDGMSAQLVSGLDLLTPPRWRVDIPVDWPAGSATIQLCEADTSLAYDLQVLRPCVGRYVSLPHSTTT